MATHSSILNWGIPRTEEPGRPPCMRLQSWTRLSTEHAHTEEEVYKKKEDSIEGRKGERNKRRTLS